ncbi:hypothetical protein SSBR45G_62560 [Bradyrhizobium sp. SSBR45G]|uniref:hypothetical protein n=1 Tax=unclassified Bradyrhizobium TaxID=2631580 RepID=UPI0023429AD3|nr:MULTISPECIES: hypothetical protein [unclassified Bradyrhizobium]GLH81347.1 hypothetical protein SSBR45G_62560 [Bradyrhizobium sp. SSBR45G]GLH85867.1 hypothetical protein SSBR45R_33270 [Bradyrhizobium sp. SSBR45R]
MPRTVRGRPTTPSLERWATAILREAGAIVECEQHGWMLDRGDPHALARALCAACDDPPRGIRSSEATAAIEDVIAAIGDTCPDCSRPSEAEDGARFKYVIPHVP